MIQSVRRFLCALIASLWWIPIASADPQLEARARALAAEERCDASSAAAAWRETLSQASGSRIAGVASRRLRYFEARSDGNYGALSDVLCAERRRLSLSEVDEMARRSDEWPMHSVVRTELIRLLAGHYQRLGRAEKSSALLRELSLGGDQRATIALAERADSDGDRARALAILESGDVPIEAASALYARSRIRFGRWTLVFVWGVVVAAGVTLWHRSRRRSKPLRWWPRRDAMAAAILFWAIPTILAERYEHSTLDTFVYLGLMMVPLLLLVDVLAQWPLSRSERSALAVIAPLAVVGVGYGLAQILAGKVLGF